MIVVLLSTGNKDGKLHHHMTCSHNSKDLFLENRKKNWTIEIGRTLCESFARSQQHNGRRKLILLSYTLNWIASGGKQNTVARSRKYQMNGIPRKCLPCLISRKNIFRRLGASQALPQTQSNEDISPENQENEFKFNWIECRKQNLIDIEYLGNLFISIIRHKLHLMLYPISFSCESSITTYYWVNDKL